MTDRCPHCSFDPTSHSDYCAKHRPGNRVSVDRGALTMALNVLRRAGKDEVADALAESAAAPSSQGEARIEGGWKGLTEDERDKAVGDLIDYGTEFVAPLYAVVEGIERKLRERNAPASYGAPADAPRTEGGGWGAPDQRQRFDAWLRRRWPNAQTPIDAKTPTGYYLYSENNLYWEAWQEAIAGVGGDAK